jgi:hypothetical protein
MADSKKPMVGLLLGADKPEKESDEGGEDAKKAAASAVMSAFESGDVDALSEALHTFVDACSY